MDGPIAEIDFRLPVVEAEGGSRLGAAVVTGIAVGHGVALSHPVISKIQVIN